MKTSCPNARTHRKNALRLLVRGLMPSRAGRSRGKALRDSAGYLEEVSDFGDPVAVRQGRDLRGDTVP